MEESGQLHAWQIYPEEQSLRHIAHRSLLVLSWVWLNTAPAWRMMDNGQFQFGFRKLQEWWYENEQGHVTRFIFKQERVDM
jgi:hypothetical protein